MKGGEILPLPLMNLLQITNYQLRIPSGTGGIITNYELRITNYELRITNYLICVIGDGKLR